MASQVLSGSSNVSYTNNTGQNVRIVINYMAGVSATATGASFSVEYRTISLSWAGISASAGFVAIGRNLAYNSVERTGLPQNSNNALASNSGTLDTRTSTFPLDFEGALPTELMLAPGQTFSASCGAYNIVVIPEAG